MSQTDLEWEKWGKQSPYFGVLTRPEFSNENLTDDTLHAFFASGDRHIEHVYEVIRAKIQPRFQPGRVLDYGCGVGRLVVPLANRSDTVVGVDVSPSMLVHARKNCERYGATSAILLHVDEMNTLAPASFDLVHSFFVFQHISSARGELILRKLIDLITEGGVGAIQFLFYDRRTRFRRMLFELRKRVPLLQGIFNVAWRKPFSTPLMEMNAYSMNHIFKILLEAHCSNLHVEFTGRDYCGAMLYFEKVPRSFL